MDNKFLLKLSQNLLEILNDDEYYDITIEVGNDPYVKIFRSHVVILYYRSPYLRRILSTNKKNNDGTLTHIKLPNISPEIFQIIIGYIYGGKLSLEEYDTPDIIKILVAANELILQDLTSHLQSFLIQNKADWMKQNFDLIYKTSFENDSFSKLQNYCTNLISKEPDKIFNSLNFSSIPEKLLVSLIQGDNLQMSEIQVWENVLKWGLAQNPELPSDPEDFSKEDFNALKNSLQQCIPFIRFYNLTSDEFSDRVLPYEDILPKELYKDLLKYFLKSNNKSKQSKPRLTKEINENSASVEPPKNLSYLTTEAALNEYFEGDFVADLEEAINLYKKVAEHGKEAAQYNLGRCYESGIGVKKDNIKAFEYYKKLAESGNIDAQFNVGFSYACGIGVKKESEKAVYWWQKAAENGNDVAQYNIGECYEFGIGVSKDEIKAFKFYKKSAENGYLTAQFYLGYCYVNGIGTEVNRSKGFELYKEAADKENQIVLCESDTEILNNLILISNLDKIHYWYCEAAGNDNKFALYKLGEYYELIDANERRAFEFYKKSADQGFVDAQYRLGYFYSHGSEIDINIEKSFEFYNMAAKGGNVDAQGILASLYEKGDGTEQNLKGLLNC